MFYLLYMSTDSDITGVRLGKAWPEHTSHQWEKVGPGGLKIEDKATIIVVAHGNNKEIGNAAAGTIDINADCFLALIHFNMAEQAEPAKIYISACAKDIAGFAAGVALAAKNNKIWKKTEIMGHWDPVSGPVPGPNDSSWHVIYQDRH